MSIRTTLAVAIAFLTLLCPCGALVGLQPAAEPRELTVRVATGDGEPVADAQVGVLTADQRVLESRTNAEGSAVLHVPQDASVQTVWAMKPGAGVDYYHFLDEDDDEQHAADAFLPQDFDRPLSLRLDGVLDASVKVVDTDTKEPLPGAVVVPWYLFKAGKGGEFNVSGLEEFSRTTDEQGIAVFDVLTVDNGVAIPFLIRAPHHVAHRIYTLDRGTLDAEITAELVRMVSLSGRVVEADGTPAVGAAVLAAGDGYHYGYFRRSTQTGDDGTFELEVSPEEYYSLVAHHGDAASSILNLVVRKGQPVGGLEISLERGTRLHGRVTVAPDMLPVANYELKLRQRPAEEYTQVAAEERLTNPGESRDYIQPLIERTTRTDASGRFEFLVGPGSYYLVGPFSAPVPRFTITDEPAREVNLVARDRGEFTEP